MKHWPLLNTKLDRMSGFHLHFRHHYPLAFRLKCRKRKVMNCKSVILPSVCNRKNRQKLRAVSSIVALVIPHIRTTNYYRTHHYSMNPQHILIRRLMQFKNGTQELVHVLANQNIIIHESVWSVIITNLIMRVYNKLIESWTMFKISRSYRNSMQRQ